jgi:hypothetical protein
VEIASPLPDSAVSDDIKNLVATHTTLEKLMLWGVQQSPPVMIAEIIAQDEFTNDIVVPYNHLYLVYDTT